MPRPFGAFCGLVRQPRELLQTDVFRTVPPEDLTPTDLAELATAEVATDPARVMQIYRRHVESGGMDATAGQIFVLPLGAVVSSSFQQVARLLGPSKQVFIRTWAQLGFLFDPNSFFSSADRQNLTRHKHFRCLAHDLWKVRADVPDAAVPLLLPLAKRSYWDFHSCFIIFY